VSRGNFKKYTWKKSLCFFIVNIVLSLIQFFKAYEYAGNRININVGIMIFDRRQFCVAELKRQMYVVGGFDKTGHIDSVVVFDPDSNKWREVASMNSKRKQVFLFF